MSLIRTRILVTGLVQGVGFRPFVYRRAVSLGLTGFVRNTPEGVEIEAEGDPDSVRILVESLKTGAPPQADVRSIETRSMPVSGANEFEIRESAGEAAVSALVSPDIATCPDCLSELFDPADRRHRYPFINCTNCGPRFTIVTGVPYDRPATTMASFVMCPACRAEYEDPENRRFHAQPNACPECGPRLVLADAAGREIPAPGRDAVAEAAAMIRDGRIVAVKGLGGFHLACDAENEAAVRSLRERKGREEKPLAVMARDADAVSGFAAASEREIASLRSWRRPIVLLAKRAPFPLAASVAPGNAFIGVMLPYTPVHHLLMAEGFQALVMTSGNVSEQPIAVGNAEALGRLAGIADAFLLHDREIRVRNDDSVVRFSRGVPAFIRRSRGWAPSPVPVGPPGPPVVAVGAEMKNTVCLTSGDRAFISPHIGDLENAETLDSFESAIASLSRLFDIRPEIAVHDLHPDYLSTQWALNRSGLKTMAVQHHHAHIASCLAENGRTGPVIGFAMDGTGYGPDGTVWGGEILVADLVRFERAGHFSVRSMPGGPAAIREPWRMALSFMDAAFRHAVDPGLAEDALLRKASGLPAFHDAGAGKVRSVLRLIRSGIPLPSTSSLGRLFDAVSALSGIRSVSTYEGQAASDLEAVLYTSVNSTDQASIFPAEIRTNGAKGPVMTDLEPYPFEITEFNGVFKIDPDKVILAVLKDVQAGFPVYGISRKFHTGLIRVFVRIAKRLRDKTGLSTAALSGGCFQNLFLLDTLSGELARAGFEVLSHSLVPANDGGLCLGQAAIAHAGMRPEAPFTRGEAVNRG
ncbi:MAG: carbamoyltransferase HypF [bacterium]|nr:carbamoyltransferase HypF [bacterium]